MIIPRFSQLTLSQPSLICQDLPVLAVPCRGLPIFHLHLRPLASSLPLFYFPLHPPSSLHPPPPSHLSISGECDLPSLSFVSFAHLPLATTCPPCQYSQIIRFRRALSRHIPPKPLRPSAPFHACTTDRRSLSTARRLHYASPDCILVQPYSSKSRL